MEEPLAVTSSEGRTICGTVFVPRGDASACFLVSGATGASHRRYHKLARYLADAGCAVVTYDYRGIGASAPEPARKSSATVTMWGAQDLPMLAAWACARFPSVPLIAMGHSVGGQLVAFVPDPTIFAGYVFLSTQDAYHGRWHGAMRLKVWATWAVAFRVARWTLGYLPGWMIGGIDVPPGVAEQGSRWGTSPRYFRDEPGVVAALARIDAAALAYSFSDDLMYGPREAIDSFSSWLTGTVVERRHVTPAELGVAKLGHFGICSQRAEPLWRELVAFAGKLAHTESTSAREGSK